MVEFDPEYIQDPILSQIGDTSIIGYPGTVDTGFLCKLEYENPTGSMKDRIAVGMIREMEARGEISENTHTIIEASSGNTGAAVALAANRLGYECTITTPKTTSQQKIGYMSAFGAEVITCDPEASSEDHSHYHRVAERKGERDGCVFLNQYQNELNPEIHYHWTGPELYDQVGEEADVIIGAMGTGGTLSGIAKYVKNVDESVRVVGVDATKSNISNAFYERSNVTYDTSIEGLGKDHKLPTMWFDYIDDVVDVSDDEALEQMRYEAKENGFLVGQSAGAVLHAAQHKLSVNEESTVLAIVCDGGEKYFEYF